MGQQITRGVQAFQFLMVRLKVSMLRVVPGQSHKFQFLMVRLKVLIQK